MLFFYHQASSEALYDLSSHFVSSIKLYIGAGLWNNMITNASFTIICYLSVVKILWSNWRKRITSANVSCPETGLMLATKAGRHEIVEDILHPLIDIKAKTPTD